MVADGEHDPEFDLIVESTGLDLEQVQSKQTKKPNSEKRKSSVETSSWSGGLVEERLWGLWQGGSRHDHTNYNAGQAFVEISLFQDHLLIDISKKKFSEMW